MTAENTIDMARRSARPDDAIRRVLVVDDSRAQRRLVAAWLARWGYEVSEAASGEEALSQCRNQPIDLVLSDWMMPGMDGLALCQAFRALPRDRYGYFILLTSKSDKGEVAHGLDAGADDFLPKPVNAEELRARIAAGERILRMERQLTEKNRIIGTALQEIRSLYDAIDRDLTEARKLQQSLIREHTHDFGAARVALALQPSGHVGGDMVGFFPIDSHKVGLYAIDVSGHGVTSAIMTARVAGLFSGSAPDQNIALRPAGAGHEARPPEAVAATLNNLLLHELETDHYLTLLYAEADLTSGQVRLVQAGHPHPLVLRRDGRIDRLGGGGMPVGLLPDARYDRVAFRLCPGDRLVLASDGITECSGPAGDELGEAGLARLLTRHRGRQGQDMLDALIGDLRIHAGHGDFRDDVSAVLFEFDGAARRRSDPEKATD